MANLKYSKLKNTGVLFELLVRQITTDTLDGKKKSPAIKIIKEFFKKSTSLSKELQLYQVLQKEKFKNSQKAEKLIDVVLEEHKKLNSAYLRRQKYNLIKEVKKHYNLEVFLKTNISNYKLNASIYRILESNNKAKFHNPSSIIKCRSTILEHISGKGPLRKTIHSKVLSEYRNQDKDLRILSYKILLEKFNKKYGALNLEQKQLLKEYINNISNTEKMKNYVDGKISGVNKELLEYSKKVPNKIIRIKLQEVRTQLNKVKKERSVGDKHLLALMRSYSLKRELKNVIK